ncbi:hypothetical protein [Roseateles violae]|uniref:ElaB/YqjD/DUF883 family membrane-anchored ribosome-binding protein n=1 Tax=Roseateles violae TaxID=3058042 RepID=A0ABT8DQP1_9BURK|nr:hypothetical protein [Pelomonas sp. PFR6]MDN3920652.1 hypothetical protein [Pelomonas sp. PFR6]
MSPKNSPLAAQADAGIDHAADYLKQGAHNALDKADELRQAAPAALSRAAAQMEDLTRRTLDRARQAGTQMREQAQRAGDATAGYVREEPMKAVLIAAAAGALAAGVFAWLSRSRDSRY